VRVVWKNAIISFVIGGVLLKAFGLTIPMYIEPDKKGSSKS
jgi:hypothetical protein